MNRKGSILIVEDEKSLSETLSDYLESKGYHCQLAPDCKSANNIIEQKSFAPDIVLMDIGLPDGNGLSLAKKIRIKSPKSVLFFLSALNDPSTRLQGLELGAHDYITKPFELKELILRLERVLSNQKDLAQTPESLSFGALKIFFSRYQLQDAHGKIISLSQKECSILKFLFINSGKVLSRDEIIDEIWGLTSFPSHRTVDNYIVTLRRWCDTDPKNIIKIESIRGIGYRLDINEG